MQSLLNQHEPFPGIVINQKYDILMKNSGFDRFVHLFLENGIAEKYNNSLKILFAPDGLRNYTQNWIFIEQFLLSRLMSEIIETQNNDLVVLYNELLVHKSNQKTQAAIIDTSLPYLELSFQKEEIHAQLFTMITSLGTALDLTAQELRVELFFPSNEATKKLLQKK